MLETLACSKLHTDLLGVTLEHLDDYLGIGVINLYYQLCP